jgi:hypothetical protein
MIRYTIQSNENAFAKYIGKKITLGLGDFHKTPEGNRPAPAEMEAINYRACLAEIAVARTLNLYWTGSEKRRRDVGGILEVRSIADPDHGLVARANDTEEAPAVLVLVDVPKLECDLLGWQNFGHAKRFGRPLDADTAWPCWILAQHFLEPMAELRRIVHAVKHQEPTGRTDPWILAYEKEELARWGSVA